MRHGEDLGAVLLQQSLGPLQEPAEVLFDARAERSLEKVGVLAALLARAATAADADFVSDTV